MSGPSGPALEGVGLTLSYYAGGTAAGTPLAGVPTTAGTYTVAVAFTGSTDYLAGSSQATFTIARTGPTIQISDAGGTYNGSPFAASASIAGLTSPAGSTLEGVLLSVSYYAGAY